MKILSAGGGSGGHVTPVVAVLAEVRKQHPEAEIRFWCDKKFEKQARDTFASFDKNIAIDVIVSGKYRRYNKLPMWRQLLRFRTIVLPNTIDAIKVGLGVLQSIGKMWSWRPDVVFTKGGFVCVPIGIAARFWNIPLVIHDSDAHPGLANRILSKWAQKIATGAPLEYYRYPKSKTTYVGIPVDNSIGTVTKDKQRALKQKLGLNPDNPLVVVTGGGLGAQRINDATIACRDELTQQASVVLVSGAGHYDVVRKEVGENTDTFQLHGFIAGNMLEYLAAADIVVTRAGMTAIAELAMLKKPTILIPNAYLTGGHQLKNAKVYADADAAYIIDEDVLEDSPHHLSEVVSELLSDPRRSQELAEKIGAFARINAARDVAQLIIDVFVSHKKHK